MGVVSVKNDTAGTEVDRSGRTCRHVFGQRIKRGKAIIPLDVTVHRRQKWGGGELKQRELFNGQSGRDCRRVVGGRNNGSKEGGGEIKVHVQKAPAHSPPRPSCPRYVINMILPSGKADESKQTCSVRQLLGSGDGGTAPR